MEDDTSFLSADFSSFEDFSSRMVLLPHRDDECTGAKVGSHEIPAEIASEGGLKEEQCFAVEEGGGSMEDVDLDNTSKAKDAAAKESTSSSEQPDLNAHEGEIKRIELRKKEIALNVVQSMPQSWGENEQDQTQLLRKTLVAVTMQAVSQSTSCTQEMEPDAQLVKNATQVPVGYVLVGIRNLNADTSYDCDTKDVPEDLDSLDFSEILTALRDASFPLSLVFAPPSDTPSSDESVVANDENETAESKGAKSPADSSTQELSGEEDSIKAETANDLARSMSIASREDAAKYAKEAASVLGGRLSRWGYQAAARAADAASQVKELRDESFRKIKEEQQNRDDHIENGDPNQLEVVDESKPELPAEAMSPEEAQPEAEATTTQKTQPQDLAVEAAPSQPDDAPAEASAAIPQDFEGPEEPCSIFLQNRSGFHQLPDDHSDPHALPRITNNSVVSVRLSKERACPLGKNGEGYTFQWYRSNTESGIVKGPSIPSEDDKNWSLLRGANYAAYQPSVFDAGHQLCCIIAFAGTNDNVSHQACHLPCLVAIDPSLLDSVKMTLLGGKKSVTFGNLRNMEDLTIFRMKIDVDVPNSDDFISSSSIFIDKGGSKDEIDETEPVSHFEAIADPAKPRLFDLICSSHGRLRLDAANRKSRESLLLALGIASFKGKLSSLTPETNLFPSYRSEAELHAENNSHVPRLQSDATPAGSPHNFHSNHVLEAKLAEMHRLLESKDASITKLQQELGRVEKEFDSCQGAERQSRVERQKHEKMLEEKIRAIEGLEKSQSDAKRAHERTVKALENEKAVLQAAVKSRDGKIEVLTSQVSELQSKASLQSDQHSSIESLKSSLAQIEKENSSAQRVITTMKETEVELRRNLQIAKETVRDLNDKLLVAKETASKRESDCRKLKKDSNILKSRAADLSKEMKRLKIIRSTEEALEIEKLKKEVHRLTQENDGLQEQLEVNKSEKRHALGKLEATYLAHQQSVVNYQQSTDSPRMSGARVSEQRINELESVVSSMTEYLNAKEMQIETLKEVNRVLTEDINKLTKRSEKSIKH